MPDRDAPPWLKLGGADLNEIARGPVSVRPSRKRGHSSWSPNPAAPQPPPHPQPRRTPKSSIALTSSAPKCLRTPRPTALQTPPRPQTRRTPRSLCTPDLAAPPDPAAPWGLAASPDLAVSLCGQARRGCGGQRVPELRVQGESPRVLRIGGPERPGGRGAPAARSLAPGLPAGSPPPPVYSSFGVACGSLRPRPRPRRLFRQLGLRVRNLHAPRFLRAPSPMLPQAPRS